MDKLKFRPATLNDLPKLLEFEQGIVNAERPMDPTLKRTPINYYDLQALVVSEEAEVAVATFEDKLIGSGYVQVRAAKPYQQFDQFGYIGFMFVEPDFRGKGVSKLILDHLEAWAKSKGLTEVRLEV